MKPYTKPLKYKSFIDEGNKASKGCLMHFQITQQLASPICIMKKKPDPSQPHKPQLQMFIDYRKVNL